MKSNPHPLPLPIQLPAYKSRITWHNVTKNQCITPLRYFEPETIDDLRAIVMAAESENIRVRAVGSGHSFSGVALTDGFMVNPKKLKNLLPLDTSQLKPEFRGRNLVHVEGGIRLCDLSRLLDKEMGLSLSSLGTIAVQTLSGAVATGTHGTGWDKPSIPDMVQAITLVTHGGRVLQIEPSHGITDPDAFDRPGVELVQNDDYFHAAVLSMGSMGITYSLVLEVIPLIWLNEVKTPTTTWSRVRQSVLSGDIFTAAPHVSLRINPYPQKNSVEHSVQMVKMYNVPPIRWNYSNLNQRFRNVSAMIGGKIPGLVDLIVRYQNMFPHTIPNAVEYSLKSTKDSTYKNKSYRVFNQGMRQVSKRGLSCEWAFPLESGNHVEAVETAFEIVQKAIGFGKLYQNSPITLRVAPPSRHFLATSFGQRMIYVEFPMVIGTKGAEEMLDRYQEAMIGLGGRPHWGKFHNRLLAADELIPPLYEKWDAWCKVFYELNPNRTFDNQFTDRMGFRRRREFLATHQQTFSPKY
ncbi:MAG: FAD-binding protein [Bacteroidia bacterium]|nr:FAD-binding protein [Bacteroidia bacterium]